MKKRFGVVLAFFICVLICLQAVEENRGVTLIKKNSTFNKYAVPFENQWALIIGIDKYKYIRKLNNAVFDVQTIRDILINNYGYRKSNIKELYNNEATWQNIYDELRSISKRMINKDSLLIYFAGHGYLDRDLGRGYWLPVDCGKVNSHSKEGLIDESKLNKTPFKIHSADIHAIMEKCNAKHIFVIADSCYSGKFLDLSRNTSRNLSSYFYKKSRHVLASGRGIVSDGPKGKHSPFARVLIDFLENNSEKYIFASRLIAHVKKIVDREHNQIPFGGAVRGVHDEDGEFIFFLKDDVYLDQTRIDFNNLQSAIKSDSLSVGEKLNKCRDFLAKYKSEPWQRLSIELKEVKAILSQVEGLKRELDKQREFKNIDLNKDLMEGDRRFEEGKYREAQYFYEKILKNRPNDPLAVDRIKKCRETLYDKNAALNFWNEKKFDAAYDYLKKLIQLSPNDKEIKERLRDYKVIKNRQFILEGDEFFNNGNIRNATQKYKEALSWLPGDALTIKKLKIAQDKSDELVQAENTRILLDDANNLFDKGKYKDAFDLYRKILNSKRFPPSSTTTKKMEICKEEVACMVMETDISLENYLDFVDRYPKSSHIPKLKDKLISNDNKIPPEKYWKNIKRNDKGYYEKIFANNHVMVYIPSNKFWIDKFEVSNGQYNDFLKSLGRSIPPSKRNDYLIEKDEYPVVVKYSEALEYCRTYEFRLPTNKEWEFIWGDKRYPWGDDPPEKSGIYRANYDTEDGKDGFVGTAPVKSFQIFSSPFGVVNLAGNVWEWVDGNAIKGGGFFSDKEDINKNILEKDKDNYIEGFRCIKEESNKENK